MKSLTYIPAATEHDHTPPAFRAPRPASRGAQLGWRAASALTTLVIVALLASVAYCALAGVRPVISRSDSMKPHSQAGDVLLARWAVPIEQANPGDVIVYRDTTRGGAQTAHRLISKQAITAGPAIVRWEIRTKGDANDRPDKTWGIQAGGKVGIETTVIPGAGHVVRALTQPVTRAILGAFILALLAASLIAGRARR